MNTTTQVPEYSENILKDKNLAYTFEHSNSTPAQVTPLLQHAEPGPRNQLPRRAASCLGNLREETKLEARPLSHATGAARRYLQSIILHRMGKGEKGEHSLPPTKQTSSSLLQLRRAALSREAQITTPRRARGAAFPFIPCTRQNPTKKAPILPLNQPRLGGKTGMRQGRAA